MLVLLKSSWDFLAVQWLGLYASTAEGNSLIPGRRTKILQAIQSGKKKKKKKIFLFSKLSIVNQASVEKKGFPVVAVNCLLPNPLPSSPAPQLN